MRRVGTGTVTISPLARHFVNKVLDSGRLSYGPYSEQFEREFAMLHGCKFGILSNSGTSSLLVALQAMKELHGWEPGDEVIVPALTFVATVNIVLQNGLKPVLVDVEPDYYGIDCSKIGRAITNRTRAVIPVHTFGQPCDMIDLRYEMDAHHLVIEDSCEAMFVGWNHIGHDPIKGPFSYTDYVGSAGDIGCFSMYAAHLLVTGVGGMAITDNPDYAKTIRSLVNHGMSYDDLSGGDNGFTPVKTRRDFVFDRVGHSFRITEMEAALGLAQLQDWREMIKRRQENAAYLTERLTPFEDRLQLPVIRPHTDHSFMMYAIVCKQSGIRDDLTRFLETRGIETRRMLPLIQQPVYKGLWDPKDYPVALNIDKNGFYTGIHQGLTFSDLDYVVEAIGDFFGSR
jgi:perosamine synthetase